MLRTRAIRRCSTAPAEALQTAGVTSAARRSRITTPLDPGALGRAADRAEVLGVLELVERDEQRVSGRQQLLGAGVGVGARPRRRRPGGPPSRSAPRSPRAAAARRHGPQPRLAGGARGRPDVVDAPVAGAPAAPRERGCGRRRSRAQGRSARSRPPRRGPPSRARRSSSRSSSAAAKSAPARALLALARPARRPPRAPPPAGRAGSRGRGRRASRADRESPAPVGAPVGLAQPLVEHGQRLGRVEVTRQSVEEALAQPAQLRRGLGARAQPPRRLADPLDVRPRLGQRGIGEGERLAVVAGGQVHHDRLGARVRRAPRGGGRRCRRDLAIFSP